MFLVQVLAFSSFLAGDYSSLHEGCYSSSSLLNAYDDAKTFEICVSPGCVADGADQLLFKMQALAPSEILVKPGVCCSLCGNGPVVLEGNKKYRKVSELKLIELLFGDEGMTSQQQAVLDAFNFVAEADDFLKQKKYEEAVELYKTGIEVGLEPALSMEGNTHDKKSSDEPSPALQWLVNARQQEATAKLNMGDVEGAVASAQSACELSNESSLEALEILQESYAAQGNTNGELETLQTYFSLPQPPKMTTMQSNKRRQLGFRLQKLEREAK